MGDRTYAAISIYGTITDAEKLAKLRAAIIAEAPRGFVTEDRLDSDLTVMGEIEETMGEEGERAVLMLDDEEVNYGYFAGIEAACKEIGLPFLASWEAGGGYGPGLKLWTPGEEEETVTTADGAPMLSLGELRMVAVRMQNDPSALDAEIARLTRFEGDQLPSFHVDHHLLDEGRSIVAA